MSETAAETFQFGFVCVQNAGRSQMSTAFAEREVDRRDLDDSDEATRLANDVRERVREVDSTARRIDELLRELDPARAQHLGLIVDSVSRSADYGGNIAETALQKAAPSP